MTTGASLSAANSMGTAYHLANGVFSSIFASGISTSGNLQRSAQHQILRKIHENSVRVLRNPRKFDRWIFSILSSIAVISYCRFRSWFRSWADVLRNSTLVQEVVFSIHDVISQHTATPCNRHCKPLQHIATHTATHTATDRLPTDSGLGKKVVSPNPVVILQHTATHTVTRTATHPATHPASHCNRMSKNIFYLGQEGRFSQSCRNPTESPAFCHWQPACLDPYIEVS